MKRPLFVGVPNITRKEACLGEVSSCASYP